MNRDMLSSGRLVGLVLIAALAASAGGACAVDVDQASEEEAVGEQEQAISAQEEAIDKEALDEEALLPVAIIPAAATPRARWSVSERRRAAEGG